MSAAPGNDADFCPLVSNRVDAKIDNRFKGLKRVWSYVEGAVKHRRKLLALLASRALPRFT